MRRIAIKITEDKSNLFGIANIQLASVKVKDSSKTIKAYKVIKKAKFPKIIRINYFIYFYNPKPQKYEKNLLIYFEIS